MYRGQIEQSSCETALGYIPNSKRTKSDISSITTKFHRLLKEGIVLHSVDPTPELNTHQFMGC